MADFTIPITVPDAKVNELVAALRWQWGPNENGTEKTPSQLRAEFKARTEQALKDVFKRYKEHLRNEQPVDAGIDIT